MLALTIFASWLACLEMPALFTLGVLAYQDIIQLSVPQFLDIFWKRGNKYSAIAGMTVGFVLAATLELMYPTGIPWAYGLASGVIALLANVSIYVVLAYLLPMSMEESSRVDGLFQLTKNHSTN